MKLFYGIICVLSLAFSAHGEASKKSSLTFDKSKVGDAPGFKLLFNGKDFTGWEGNKEWFRVEKGAIVAGKNQQKIPHNFFLATEKEYYNFELRLQVKMNNDIRNNGGIQIRSSRIENHHEMIGYQADVGMKYWGYIYDESRRRKFVGKPAAYEDVKKILNWQGWNDYTIICKDNTIKTFVNGYLISDYTEDDAKIAKVSGKIAVQIHGGKPLEIFYRNIRLKELK